MTDPAEPLPLRHAAVYRTVRGLALSGSRALPAAAARHGGNLAPAAPLRVSAVLRVRPASEIATLVTAAAPIGNARVEPEPGDAVGYFDADGIYDATGNHDARRYREPND